MRANRPANSETSVTEPTWRERTRLHRLGPTLSALLIWVGISCTADRPKLSEGGDVENQCSTYADLLVAFTPPGETGTSPEGEAALGEPDGEGVALEANATLTVSFVGLGGIINGDGDDIRVVGSHVADTRVAVYAQADEALEYTFVGNIEPDADTVDYFVDLATGSVSFAFSLRFVGQSETLTIDAVESISSSCDSP